MLHETRSINTVIAVIPLLVVLSACGERSLDREAKVQEAAVRANYAKAKALFEQRCKTAGVVIKRTVKDVEGIEILKVRPVLAWGDKRYFDPMFDGAAMAAEAQGDGYIASFLYSELRNPNTPERRGVVQPPTSKPGMNQDAPRQGYRYVDVRDPVTSTVLRYRIALHLTEAQWYQRGGWAKDLEHTVRTGPQARFAVDYEDIVDPVDRAYWIAGTRIKVIDRQNGEAIAQLTRYVWDQGVGGSSTGRWPWQHASAQGNECPTSQSTHYTTRFFIDTVLIPKQGD